MAYKINGTTVIDNSRNVCACCVTSCCITASACMVSPSGGTGSRPSNVTGSVFFDTDTGGLVVNDGSQWVAVGGGGDPGTPATDDIVSDGDSEAFGIGYVRANIIGCSYVRAAGCESCWDVLGQGFITSSGHPQCESRMCGTPAIYPGQYATQSYNCANSCLLGCKCINIQTAYSTQHFADGTCGRWGVIGTTASAYCGISAYVMGDGTTKIATWAPHNRGIGGTVHNPCNCTQCTYNITRKINWVITKNGGIVLEDAGQIWNNGCMTSGCWLSQEELALSANLGYVPGGYYVTPNFRNGSFFPGRAYCKTPSSCCHLKPGFCPMLLIDAANSTTGGLKGCWVVANWAKPWNQSCNSGAGQPVHDSGFPQHRLMVSSCRGCYWTEGKIGGMSGVQGGVYRWIHRNPNFNNFHGPCFTCNTAHEMCDVGHGIKTYNSTGDYSCMMIMSGKLPGSTCSWCYAYAPYQSSYTWFSKNGCYMYEMNVGSTGRWPSCSSSCRFACVCDGSTICCICHSTFSPWVNVYNTVAACWVNSYSYCCYNDLTAYSGYDIGTCAKRFMCSVQAWLCCTSQSDIGYPGNITLVNGQSNTGDTSGSNAGLGMFSCNSNRIYLMMGAPGMNSAAGNGPQIMTFNMDTCMIECMALSHSHNYWGCKLSYFNCMACCGLFNHFGMSSSDNYFTKCLGWSCCSNYNVADVYQFGPKPWLCAFNNTTMSSNCLGRNYIMINPTNDHAVMFYTIGHSNGTCSCKVYCADVWAGAICWDLTNKCISDVITIFPSQDQIRTKGSGGIIWQGQRGAVCSCCGSQAFYVQSYGDPILCTGGFVMFDGTHQGCAIQCYRNKDNDQTGDGNKYFHQNTLISQPCFKMCKYKDYAGTNCAGYFGCDCKGGCFFCCSGTCRSCFANLMLETRLAMWKVPYSRPLTCLGFCSDTKLKCVIEAAMGYNTGGCCLYGGCEGRFCGMKCMFKPGVQCIIAMHGCSSFGIRGCSGWKDCDHVFIGTCTTGSCCHCWKIRPGLYCCWTGPWCNMYSCTYGTPLFSCYNTDGPMFRIYSGLCNDNLFGGDTKWWSFGGAANTREEAITPYGGSAYTTPSSGMGGCGGIAGAWTDPKNSWMGWNETTGQTISGSPFGMMLKWYNEQFINIC